MGVSRILIAVYWANIRLEELHTWTGSFGWLTGILALAEMFLVAEDACNWDGQHGKVQVRCLG